MATSEAKPPIKDLEHVWQPLEIGATTVKHRIMVTGHSQLYGRDQIISDRHIDYYAERARGGAALLVLEQQAVHPAGMNYHAGCGAFDERALPAYRALAEAVHPHGCKQFVQLFGCGVQGKGTQYIHNFRPLWAASAIPSILYNEAPMMMRQREIDEIIDGFGRSAANVEAAGLDGVEVHAAHNQLVGGFLSPAFNHRDDGYGGSVENRCRFLLEILQEVRRRTSDQFTVGVRMTFDDLLGPGVGITPEDCEEQLSLLVAADLIDFFDISMGGYHSLHVGVSPMGGMAEGFMVPSARRAKLVVGQRAKVFVVGRILDFRMADQIVGEGTADMVAMTRAHMAEPFLVRKALEGREREMTRCVGVNVCIRRLVEDVEITCAFNPAMGRERELGEGTFRSAPEPRRIAVIGGGPAGLRFASAAARRGHRVVLFERARELGGHLNLLGRLPSRENWRTGIDNLVWPVEDAGVEIRLDTSATPDCLGQEDFSLVVCATGSVWDRTGYSPRRPGRPAVPGADQDWVIDIATAIDAALVDPRALGEKVLIVDETGGYLPIGLAEILASQGGGNGRDRDASELRRRGTGRDPRFSARAAAPAGLESRNDRATVRREHRRSPHRAVRRPGWSKSDRGGGQRGVGHDAPPGSGALLSARGNWQV